MERPPTLRERVGITSQSYSIEASAAEGCFPVTVTLSWCHPGLPTEKADRDAVAETMKRIDEGARAFLDAMYPCETTFRDAVCREGE